MTREELKAALRTAADDYKRATDEVLARYAASCWCASCETVVLEQKFPDDPIARLTGRRFITCRDCGDKRCPRAAHHDRECQQ